VSLEALVRWRHPEQGWISPSDFIPLAEESGLIFALGEFVLRTACRQIVAWEREGVSVVPVAVNISAVQLRRRDLADVVRGILRETGLEPNQLALELTESALIENLSEHHETLESLRRDGISIEIDDFGTGYSSLSYLKHLPADSVKIDRSFIRQIDTNPADAAIVSAIIEMSHSVGLSVVAEGVETPGQLQLLGRLGCDIAQGFFFARPLWPGDCKSLLAAAARRLTFTDTLRLLAHEYPIVGLSECA
jgi:EAL domain-containing protein (putative c-di-GMP-specific phosphodiesterase class I)